MAAPSASATAGCGAQLFNPPVQDASCAMPTGGNNTDIMAACCGSADVVSYYDGYGLYCLAVGQSVADLTSCLYAHGAPYGTDVFCRGNTSATATATDAPLPTSAGASIVVTHSGASSPTQGGSSTSGSSSSTNSPGAAAGLRPEFGSLTTLGLAIGALLFSATAFGAFQL
ncbi:hypothetical protein GGR54DRAFT_612879 [Hypoxylon sp. NC1633]|nr:hypothetical protein GGR54DRAFT_612879 [Hypoxylon sp. NC1633]